jgi:hypothetical protein
LQGVVELFSPHPLFSVEFIMGMWFLSFVAASDTQPEPTNMNTQKLAEHALNTWTTNLMRLKNARFALFDIDGQYHGAFTDEPSAHAYVDEVASTPAWVGDGYQVVKFR